MLYPTLTHQIAELTHLFEHSLTISPNPSTSSSTEQKELSDMISKIRLGQAGSMQSQQQEWNMRQAHSLMQSPHNIKDLNKFSWMDQLNLKYTPLAVNHEKSHYLNTLLRMFDTRYQQNRFQFVQVYPHSQNLAANCPIRKGETVLQIPQMFMIGISKKSRTLLYEYLLQLMIWIYQGKQVLKSHSSLSFDTMMYKIRKAQDLAIPTFIFQRKFVEDIVRYGFNNSMNDAFEWLYFKLLPEEFDYHPMKEWETIKHYHPHLSKNLQKMEHEFLDQYKFLKQLVFGQIFRKEYTFQDFLVSYKPNGVNIANRYLNLFTAQNYVWTKLCERTRTFEILNNNNDSFESAYMLDQPIPPSKRKLVPFLDLLHHSTTHNNLSWEFDFVARKLVIKAETNIKSGDLLYIPYKKMALQELYINFGFVDGNEPGYANLNLPIDLDLVEWIASELYDKTKIKRRFLNFLEQHSKTHEEKMIEVRVFDSDHYNDPVRHKQTVLQITIQAYTELTKIVLNKHDPQINIYLKNQKAMRTKLRRMLLRYVASGLRENISRRKQKLWKIEERSRDRMSQNYGGVNQIDEENSFESTRGSMESVREGRERRREGRQKGGSQLTKEQKRKFNTLYHQTALSSILLSEIRILQNTLRLFEKNRIQ